MSTPKREQPAYSILAAAIEGGDDHTVKSATAFLRVHRQSARAYLALMHADGLVHIASWRQTGARGRWFAVYRWGGGKDAPRPGRDERLARRRLKVRVDTHGITLAMLLGVAKR